jgi:hypothetical protein
MNQHHQSASEKPVNPIRKACARGGFSFVLTLTFTFVCFLSHFSSSARAEHFCIDYEYFPNTNNLRVFDFAILSPYCEVDLMVAHAAGKKVYAYISAGEIAASAQYYQAAQTAGIPFIAQNPNWDSMVVDLASPLWAPFVINQLALPAINKGYDGFFLDTMDSYYLADSSLVTAQEAGLVSMVRALKAAYPSKKIITNRGFPVFSRLANTIDGMLVEGLYYTYPGVPQTSAGTTWLLAQIAPVKAAGKPVYIVDYLAPAQSGSANQVAQQIAQLGFTPMISPPDLDGTVLAPMPPLRIEKVVRTSGVPKITFTALKGKPYSVERTASVQHGPWVKVSDVAAQATTSMIEVRDTSAAGTMNIYRLRTP